MPSGKITVKGISIAKEILTGRFAPCNLRACRHICCKDGAVIGSVRAARIKRALPELFKAMRPEAVELVRKKGFFLDTVYARSDMDPGHEHHYMRTVKGRCVFLNFDDKGGCVLQKYCKKHGMKYQLKPDGCWGFPIDQIGDRLVLYKWYKLPCLDVSKNRKSPPIYKSCKFELSYFLGEDGYKELLRKIGE